MDTWSHRKNEPKTNPIRTQTKPIEANLKKAKMNITKDMTKDYEEMSNWAIYPKQTQTKPIYRGVASGEDGFQRQKMLLTFTLLEVLEKAIMTGYYLEQQGPLNRMRLP